MIERTVERLMRWCEKRGKVVNITGTAGPEDVYLIRYILARNKFFSIYIHQFLRSDRDDLHDHPWHFATYLVRGAYTERKWNPETQAIDETRRVNCGLFDHREVYKYLNGGSGTGSRKQNTFIVRKATDQHQVVVDEDLKPSQKNEAALTLFFGGPVIREWGFVKELKACAGRFAVTVERRWIPWREYLGLPPDHPSR